MQIIHKFILGLLSTWPNSDRSDNCYVQKEFCVSVAEKTQEEKRLPEQPTSPPINIHNIDYTFLGKCTRFCTTHRRSILTILLICCLVIGLLWILITLTKAVTTPPSDYNHSSIESYYSSVPLFAIHHGGKELMHALRILSNEKQVHSEFDVDQISTKLWGCNHIELQNRNSLISLELDRQQLPDEHYTDGITDIFGSKCLTRNRPCLSKPDLQFMYAGHEGNYRLAIDFQHERVLVLASQGTPLESCYKITELIGSPLSGLRLFVEGSSHPMDLYNFVPADSYLDHLRRLHHFTFGYVNNSAPLFFTNQRSGVSLGQCQSQKFKHGQLCLEVADQYKGDVARG
jgi:hypothetical protein